MRFQPVTEISSMLPCNIVGAGVIDVQNSDTASLRSASFTSTYCNLHDGDSLFLDGDNR